jgi:hypothetical protein
VVGFPGVVVCASEGAATVIPAAARPAATILRVVIESSVRWAVCQLFVRREPRRCIPWASRGVQRGPAVRAGGRTIGPRETGGGPGSSGSGEPAERIVPPGGIQGQGSGPQETPGR